MAPKVFDSASLPEGREYVLKYNTSDEFLPSTVLASNFTLLASGNGKNVPVSSVEYLRGENTLYIYPERVYNRNATYLLSATENLLLANGETASVSQVAIEPEIEWAAEPCGVSVAYSTYKKNGVYLYVLNGQTKFSAEFQIVNTDRETKYGVPYTIYPSGDPSVVFSAGTFDITAGGSVSVSAMVEDYIMGQGETVEILIGA